MAAPQTAGDLRGRLVLAGRVVPGRVEVEDGRIASVTPDAGAAGGPFITPGFVDVHCHGWGGHYAMGGASALDGMARALVAHGVTSFLPTAVTAPYDDLVRFAEQVRAWIPVAPADASAPLGFNIEGPCISTEKKGAQNPAYIQAPSVYTDEALAPILEGLRIMTVAPELPGAIDLIRRLAAAGVSVSLGHSNATADEGAAGYLAGGRTTTHLFNAMSGVDNHHPGMAVASLGADDAYSELIADGLHVERALWPMIVRTKPDDRLILVSDAITLAGVGEGRFQIGDLEVEVRNGSCRLVSDGRLAGSVIALDTAVRNLVEAGVPIAHAVRAATRNPLALLGVTDRGEIAVGQRADVVVLDDALTVQGVMLAGSWLG